MPMLNFRRGLSILIVFGLCLVIISTTPYVLVADNEVDSSMRMGWDGNFTEWITDEEDTATKSSYMLVDHHGGWWADAEKIPGSDGGGSDGGAGHEDDLLCWAATCSNMLEWTGWGFVNSMDGADDFMDYYEDHVTDYGSLNIYGLQWWFNGNLPTHSGDWSTEDVAGGDFWSSSYTWSNYVDSSTGGSDIMPFIDSSLRSGYAVGLGIYPITPPGGHAITCWGYNYDPAYDKSTDPEDHYLGVWVSDSDSHKNNATPDDFLIYYEVEWDSTNSYWYMPNYGSGWKISAADSLQPFPGETRPVANDGGPYTVNEGSVCSFSGSGSSDVDGDTLTYRWDYDGDVDWDTSIDWDTSWSSSSSASHTWYDDYSGEVYLEVFDGRMRDTDVTTVTVNNVAPSITVTGDTINENGVATVSGTIYDPGTLDTFTIEIDWGEGSPVTYAYGAGSTSFSETHQYLDDDPTGTISDTYSIAVTITDDDGGMDSGSGTVTVNNVNPTVTSSGDTINENGVATVSGTISDPGTLDTFSVQINWGEGVPQTYYYPAGTTSYSETHQYLDDNPTATLSDIYAITVTVTDDDTGVGVAYTTVTVDNVDPVLGAISMDQPNPQFILPLVHELDFTVSFTDTGTQDTHTAVWDWDDSSTTAGTVTETSGSGTVTGSHTFSTPGTYVVELTLTDDDGGTDSATFTVIVIDADEAIEDLNDYIQGLDDDCFKNNADKRKDSVGYKIDAILKILEDGSIKGVIKALNEDIRQKADGQVDGKSGDDWITDEDAQDHICMKIDDIVDYLEYFL